MTFEHVGDSLTVSQDGHGSVDLGGGAAVHGSDLLRVTVDYPCVVDGPEVAVFEGVRPAVTA